MLSTRNETAHWLTEHQPIAAYVHDGGHSVLPQAVFYVNDHLSPFQQSACEQELLSSVVCQFQRAQRRCPCQLTLAQLHQQLTPDRVKEVVVFQVSR